MKTPKPCGTDAAYYRHRANGETPCRRCRLAHTVAERRRTGGKPRRLKPCGTEAAYRRHIANGEPTCRACCDAHAARCRPYYKRTEVPA